MTLETGSILQTDVFSHTRNGSPWVNHSWLSQVVLYWLFNHYSYAGLGLWIGTVVTATFVFVYLQMEGDAFTRASILVLAAAALDRDWVHRAPVVLVITGVYRRTTGKYGQRGRRYVHMEVGHAAQNLFLQAEDLGLGSVVVGAFYDDEVAELLQLSSEFAPLALMPVGKK